MLYGFFVNPMYNMFSLKCSTKYELWACIYGLFEYLVL